MNIEEAYKIMQAEWVRENDVREEDTIKILRKYETNELGCYASRCSWVGQTATVKKINSNSIYVTSRQNQGNHPFFVLEIVEQPRKPEKMITVEGKEYSESTLAKAMKEYVG